MALPGDVVVVRQGEYTEVATSSIRGEEAVLNITVSGTAENPIIFEAFPGESVTITGAGGARRGVQIVSGNIRRSRFIELRGFIVRDLDEVGVLLKGASDVVVREVDVSGCRLGAIGVHYSDRVTIEGCRVHDNPMSGWTSAVNLWKCGTGSVVRGNFIWANSDEDARESEGHGIILDYCEAGGQTLIENNAVWDNEGWCVAVFHSDGATLRNNTCWMNGNGRRDGTGELSVRGSRASILNNILVSRGSGPALKIHDHGNPETVVCDFNIYWTTKWTGRPPWWSKFTTPLADFPREFRQERDQNSLMEDPMLLDPAQGLFDLTTHSPAVDSGDDNNAAAIDIAGHSRPVDGDGDGHSQSDIGAYEFIR